MPAKLPSLPVISKFKSCKIKNVMSRLKERPSAMGPSTVTPQAQSLTTKISQGGSMLFIGLGYT